jgi:hypothetical protein
LTDKDRILWCAVKYAHAIDDEESTAAVLNELKPRIPYLEDAVLWDLRKATGGYLDTANQFRAKHVSEWEAVVVLIDDELSARRKALGGTS